MVGVSCTRGTFRPRCNPVSPYHVGGHLQGPIYLSQVKNLETSGNNSVCQALNVSVNLIQNYLIFHGIVYKEYKMV